MSIDGQRDPEPAIDVFTGLRGRRGSRDLQDINIVRADTIEKRVQTPTGLDPQHLISHRDGVNLFVAAHISDRDTLKLLSDEFELDLNNSDIDAVLQSGLNHKLELLRLDAVAQSNDADRLDVYFGEDDLREKLPKGLWQGLESQGLITRDTSVAELLLSVYGKDTIREVSDLFTREGFPDVPNQWAGGPSTKSWLRKMGFGDEFAGQRSERHVSEFVVPGASILPDMHAYQARISADMRDVILEVDGDGRRAKAMVELPTGAGKTRIATQTLLQMFIDGDIQGPVLWIAQSQELCEQAVQTFAAVWRGLSTDQRIDIPITIGRLWDNNEVHAPATEHSVIVATDAKLDTIRTKPEYDWLTEVSAVLIDEGHVAGASTRYTRLLSWLGVDGHNWKRPLIGLSATPFKGTSIQATEQLVRRFGRRKLTPFREEQNPYQELVALGVLARVKHDILDGARVTLSAEESSEATQMKRVSGTVLDKVAADHGRMGTLVNSIMNLPPDRKKSVLVFTPNVLSAQVLAATLRFRGINAASVSGRTGRQERREVIGRFKNDEIQVLTNCDLLTQGFDAPGVTALYIARPTFSPMHIFRWQDEVCAARRTAGKKNA
ncbi:DEAD/DEAH box helicase family protein [Arthrobacter sp. JCM 19049]|uniref:DEAD/DEAH box helicase n=1 Tax=Arthrobacter sp. JCM 19049 TaxID=1460643 RepID=UPI0024363E19|nr:DEAD/DEAH box helicase family protein [Arthrobacter sp. JCM 19049]